MERQKAKNSQGIPENEKQIRTTLKPNDVCVTLPVQTRDHWARPPTYGNLIYDFLKTADHWEKSRSVKNWNYINWIARTQQGNRK